MSQRLEPEATVPVAGSRSQPHVHRRPDGAADRKPVPEKRPVRRTGVFAAEVHAVGSGMNEILRTFGPRVEACG